ncbi:hypothetical protein [Actinoplanes sp. NBRC 103695]|uniref:hypothetical protein n=1 Tax=Actinoplanes sp. NBRC 103695 TaxID=3032202 RepID=UPI0024A2BFD5|nr:hypothetical protein [Actinoplanes sp. NBRC 103695]GLY94086.1 hypothetical protein Acsp02_13420 [Actinoplanes sp. NBRC 103695]
MTKNHHTRGPRVRSGRCTTGALSRLAGRPQSEEEPAGPEDRRHLEHELGALLAAIPPSAAQQDREWADAILDNGRRELRRQRIRTLTGSYTLAVLAILAAGAGLLCGVAM